MISLLISPQFLSAYSLWMKSTNNERGMFAERIATDIGDILTVKIDESNNYKADLDVNMAKPSSTFDNPLNTYVLREAAGLFGFNRGDITEDKFKSTSTHQANGSVELKESTLQTTFSVTVVDRLPNNNLVIEGVRKVTFSEQTFYSILRGIVRHDDIPAENIISSQRISEMSIEVIAEGTLSDTQRKGLINRINDSLNLF